MERSPCLLLMLLLRTMPFLNLRSKAATSTIRRTLWASVATATVLAGTLPLTVQPATASATDTRQSYIQGAWRTALHMARLQEDQLVMQLDVTDKPATTYANAIYQLYAYHNNRWVQVHTNQGARLIRNDRGRVVLASEVIDCGKVSRVAGFDIRDTPLKSVVTVRYDSREGRDRRVVFQQERRYHEIARSQSAQLVSWDRYAQSDDARSMDGDRVRDPHRQERSSFRLMLAQNTQKMRKVVARLALKEQTQPGFKPERFLGDYRYELSRRQQHSMLIDGLRAGDRVVVRLFDQQDRFIGYSEFEVQRQHSLVTLVVGDQRSLGVVRTIQGIDRDDDGQFDTRQATYDYFTQVSRTSDWRQAQVRFLRTSRGIYVSDLAHSLSPRPAYDCVTPVAFNRDRLLDRSLYAFDRRLSRQITSRPGHVVQVVDLYQGDRARYEVKQLFRDYESASEQRDVIFAQDKARSPKMKYERPKPHKFGRKFKQKCKCYDDDRDERRSRSDDDDDDD